MCVDAIDIRTRLIGAADAGVSALLDLTLLLFEFVPGDSPRGGGERLVVRTDVDELWNQFLAVNDDLLNDETVAALYLVDEPVWNGATPDDIERAAAIVERDLGDIPAAIVEAPDSLPGAVFPASIDWVGFDVYGIRDPATDDGFAELMSALESVKTQEQAVVIVMDSQWLPVYREVGLDPGDMADITSAYFAFAAARTDVVALVGYSWPGGIDGPEQLGARDLPANVVERYRDVGASIVQR